MNSFIESNIIVLDEYLRQVSLNNDTLCFDLYDYIFNTKANVWQENISEIKKYFKNYVSIASCENLDIEFELYNVYIKSKCDLFSGEEKQIFFKSVCLISIILAILKFESIHLKTKLDKPIIINKLKPYFTHIYDDKLNDFINKLKLKHFKQKIKGSA